MNVKETKMPNYAAILLYVKCMWGMLLMPPFLGGGGGAAVRLAPTSPDRIESLIYPPQAEHNHYLNRSTNYFTSVRRSRL